MSATSLELQIGYAGKTAMITSVNFQYENLEEKYVNGVRCDLMENKKSGEKIWVIDDFSYDQIKDNNKKK
jgi:hemolysin-activating ACP:hemolysin acyltransferase